MGIILLNEEDNINGLLLHSEFGRPGAPASGPRVLRHQLWRTGPSARTGADVREGGVRHSVRRAEVRVVSVTPRRRRASGAASRYSATPPARWSGRG